MAAMPAISWTKSIRIHHESSGMQFGFFFFEVREDSEPTASRCRSNQVVPLTMLSQRVLQMRGRWLRSSDEVLLPTKIRHEQCKCRVERVGNGQVKRLHTQVELVGPVPDAHEPGLGYAMSRDYAVMPPCHLLLAIRRRSSNRIVPVREVSVHRLGERVEDSLACVPLIHRDGQKVKVMHRGFVADADANIAVRRRHVGLHVERDRERLALPQQLRDAQQIHRTDKTSIAAHNPFRARANAPDAEYLFRLHSHL
jgi:hypothetical protein